MVGDEFGNLMLEANISRAEVAKVISVAYGIDGADGETFADVEDSHWAKGYIASMKKSGIIPSLTRPSGASIWGITKS